MKFGLAPTTLSIVFNPVLSSHQVCLRAFRICRLAKAHRLLPPPYSLLVIPRSPYIIL